MELRDQLQSTLGDAYRIERELEAGGMSRVFVARDGYLGRQVVVKTLSPDLRADVSAERFRREIRLAASLQQANIVPLLTAGEIDGVPYYTMPYVEGENLRSRLASRGPLSVAETVSILRDVARALAFAHERGVVHRDIKPDNVLLSGSTAVVTDFGIARAIDAARTASSTTLTQAGLIVGTPAYVAPEQACGAPDIDHRVDIYALGVLAYELLTGEPPFAGRSAQATLAAHVLEKPANVRERRSDTPPQLAQLVMRCLEKEQSLRPATALEVLAALETALAPETRSIAPGDSRARSKVQTIAVLPLRNHSATPDDEYFSDGITEEIVARLSQIASLRVISCTSAMRYKKTSKSLREIAAELGATHVVEGSVRRAANRLRITAQLIEADTEARLWGETFDRELIDVFAIQDEVAERLAAALESQLTAAERDRVARSRAFANLDAYDAYLRGRFHWNKGTPDGYSASVAHFERALAMEPNYAEAHLGIADALCYLAIFAGDSTKHFPKARAHVTRALQLDPLLAGAHATLAYIDFWFDWNWAEAERRFIRAIELGPNSAIAHNYYSVFLSNLGRPDEALKYSFRNVELDPLWSTAHHDLGFALFQAGRFDEAIGATNRALELAPDYAPALIVRGFAQLELGDYAAALASYRRCISTSPNIALASAGLVQAFVRSGEMASARKVLHDMEQASVTHPVQASSLAWAHCAFEDLDAAFGCIDRMVREREAFTVCLPSFAWWDPLRTDPRFGALLERLQFPAWSRAMSQSRAQRAAPAKALERPLPFIAVLPFDNLSASADDEYFSDGITEDIIARLSQIASLKVISRTSVMRYKKSNKNTRDIAAELGASHIVEGSVRRAGQRLRIVAQFIDAASDAHLWAGTFDRDLIDVFAIQTEVAERVANALRARLTAGERARIERPPTRDMEAYRLYLLGRHYWAEASPEAIARAIDAYGGAIARDPTFAQAYAALSVVYCWHAGGYFGVRPREAGEKVLANAQRALELDPDLAEAHLALSYIDCWHRYEFASAVAHADRALEIAPNFADAFIFRAFPLLALGRRAECVEAAKRASELDPASFNVRGHAVCFFAWTDRSQEALEELRAVESQLGDSFFLAWARWMVLTRSGRAADAVENMREWHRRVPATLSEINLGLTLAAAGESAEAREIFDRIRASESSEYVWPTGMAWGYGLLGDMDRALDYLERAYEERAGLMNLIAYHHGFDPLRGQPRFEAIARQIAGGTAVATGKSQLTD